MRSVTPRVTETAGWRRLASEAIQHLWMGDRFAPYLGLLLWATVAAAGFLVVDEVFNVWPATPPAWLVAIAAGAFALVDWAESAQNFTVAARGESPPDGRSSTPSIGPAHSASCCSYLALVECSTSWRRSAQGLRR